jgi:hypothetical protein
VKKDSTTAPPSDAVLIARIRKPHVFDHLNAEHVARAQGLVAELRRDGFDLSAVVDGGYVDLTVSPSRGLSERQLNRLKLHRRPLARLLLDPNVSGRRGRALAPKLTPAKPPSAPPPPPLVLSLPLGLVATGVAGPVARPGWRPDRGPRELKRELKRAELLRRGLARRRRPLKADLSESQLSEV